MHHYPKAAEMALPIRLHPVAKSAAHVAGTTPECTTPSYTGGIFGRVQIFSPIFRVVGIPKIYVAHIPSPEATGPFQYVSRHVQHTVGAGSRG